MARSDEDYGRALDELDELHRLGKISDGRYELHRQKLLAEATAGRPLIVKLLIWFAFVVAVFVVLRVVVAIVGG